MKILVDARSLGSRPSGIGIYIYNFVKQLLTYQDLEISLITDVIVSDEMKELSKTDGVRVYAYGTEIQKSLSLYAYYRFVQKRIHEVKPDVFWEGNNLVPVRMKNPYGKFVTTVHDMFPLYMPECYGKIYPWYFRYGMNRTVRQVDAIIYNSEETKKETEQYFPKARRVESFLSYIVVNCSQKTTVSNQDYFLYIGNLEKRKGTDILFRAYEEYRRQGGGKKLLFAGKFRESEIERLYQEISKRVDGLEYVGYATEEMKDKLLAECSCFVFPSRAEGFGIPVVEALIYRKPVLVSDLSIFREIVGNTVTYVPWEEEQTVVRWAESMLQAENEYCETAYTNPYSAEKLGENLYQFLKRKTES